MTNNPELAGKEYRDLVQQRFLISKHSNTSYQEAGSLSPLERRYILEFIADDLQKKQEAYEKLRGQKS